MFIGSPELHWDNFYFTLLFKIIILTLKIIVNFIVVLLQILFVMGFRPADAVPVHHREIFSSGLAGRAQSSGRMSMDLNLTNVSFVFRCLIWGQVDWRKRQETFSHDLFTLLVPDDVTGDLNRQNKCRAVFVGQAYEINKEKNHRRLLINEWRKKIQHPRRAVARPWRERRLPRAPDFRERKK